MTEAKRDDASSRATAQAHGVVDAPSKLARRWSFWAIQLVAWGAYGFLTYLSDLPSLAEAQMFSMVGVDSVVRTDRVWAARPGAVCVFI